MNRRDFLGQMAIALTVAGIAHTIPAAALAVEPPRETTDFIRLPHRITGLSQFMGQLIIFTDGGVFLAPSDGVSGERFEDDLLLLNLTPEAQKTIYVQKIGDLPHRLERVPVENIRVEFSLNKGSYVMWSVNDEDAYL